MKLFIPKWVKAPKLTRSQIDPQLMAALDAIAEADRKEGEKRE